MAAFYGNAAESELFLVFSSKIIKLITIEFPPFKHFKATCPMEIERN